MDVQKVIILGATGSIGDTTLKVIRRYPQLFQVAGISYHANHEKVRGIIEEFKVPHVFCSSAPGYAISSKYTSHENFAGLLDVDFDIAIVAIVGSAGVAPTLYAVNRGKKILLANKESLVMAGSLIMAAARRSGCKILPVDSEHNSLFRLLAAAPDPETLTITASGGALRDFSLENFSRVTVADVLKHPTWTMGAKVTVDSATMVNKSLEIIEAHHLFGKDYDRLNAVVHPASYVHAILRHNDGSCFFHVYKPDMIYSIAFCMFYPELSPSFVEGPVSTAIPDLTFYDIDPDRYPGYYLGIQSGRKKGVYPAVFNAANEEAVAHFLDEKIKYADIVALVANALGDCPAGEFDASAMEGLFQADGWARQYVRTSVIKHL